MFKSLFWKLFVFFLIFSVLPAWWIGQNTLKDSIEANNASLAVIKSVGAKALSISDKALEQTGQKLIENIGYTVSEQTSLYFHLYPRYLKETTPQDRKLLNTDKAMRDVIMQPVGKKGFTVIHGDKWITWVHRNPKVVGFDTSNFKTKFPAFWDIIYNNIGLKKNYGGYYEFPDPDGVPKRKYMYCVVIKMPPAFKDVNLSIASTTFTEEFNQPMREVSEEILTLTGAISKATRTAFQKRGTEMNITLMGFVCFVLSIMAIFFITSEIGKPLKALAEVSTKVSEGSLNVEISNELKSKPDELGEMANSLDKIVSNITSMQRNIQRKK